MVTSAELAQAFADAAAADPPLIDLAALRTQCLAKIVAGGGQISFTLGAGLNGKNASQECRWDAADLLAVVTRALATPATDPSAQIVGVTYCDFSDFNVPR